MSCLFCGKEIGPLRLLRREEFCSSVHRKLYKDRLGKVLGAIGAPEPPPAPVAGFLTLLPPCAGPRERSVMLEEFSLPPHPPRNRSDWPVVIPTVLGGNREPSVPFRVAAPKATRPVQFRIRPLPTLVDLYGPPFAIAAVGEFERLREVAALLASQPAGAVEMPGTPPADSVARPVNDSAADLSTAGVPLQLPLFDFGVDEELDRLQEVAALRASDLGVAAPSLPAVPVARLVVPAAELQSVEAAASVALPSLQGQMSVVTLTHRPQLAAPVEPTDAPALRAMPAARLVASSSELQTVDVAVPVALPAFQGLSITALAQRPQQATLLQMSERREVPSGAEQPRTGATLLPFQRAEQLPRFDVTACFEPLAAPVETVPRPPTSEEWMVSPPPVLVARMVLPSVAEAVPAFSRAPLMLSAAASLSLGFTPQLPNCLSWQSAPAAEAVLVNAFPTLVADPALAGDVKLPAMPAWQAKDALRGAHAGPAESPAPEAVETWPAVEACTPAPEYSAPRLALPMLTLAPVTGSTRLESSTEPDMAPRPALPAPAAAQVVVPMMGNTVFVGQVSDLPGLGIGQKPDLHQLPPAGFATIDFHCRPTPGAIVKRPRWKVPAIPVTRPRLAIRPLFDRWEDLAPPPPPPTFTFDKVVSIQRKLVQIATSKRTRHTVGSIAAGLFLGAALWFGTGSVRTHRNTQDLTPDVAVNEAPVAPVRRASSGAISKLRQAISDRAAVSWSDSFRGGMESWGAAAKSWAPGWSRSADGYVQPGSLAIFHPTVSYTDYTLEFFGQIEHKSMDWVVRAKDSQNYYAMKFTVVEPGLRPIIAMVHYAVVGGKKGRSTQTPLMNVMVHNSRPMQVQVDVHGNHFTASVDGQEVESWSDATPTSGGVGFFAEAGEKARLYWMRVSKNEDFLGRICAYFSGSNRQTAELWPEEPYGRPHQDGPSIPTEPAEALGLASIVTLRRSRTRTLAFRAAPYFAERRIETWRS